MLGIILVNVYVITIGFDVGTDMVSLDVSLMVIMMVSLRDYCLKNSWDLLMVKFWTLMKASNWDYLMVKVLALY